MVTVRSIAITFAVAMVFYFIAYHWLSKKQTARGPWHVTFTKDNKGVPELIIAQPALNIANVRVRFPGETLTATQRSGVVDFAKPKMPVPFGEVVYDDLMFLPGTLVLDCFGHEIEMLPRTLVLNRKTVAWTNNVTHDLTAEMKLAPEQRKKKAGYKR
jgi:hypothetical protein